jgi:hypothetical protein
MRPSLALPRGKTVLDVADASRLALDQFSWIDPNDKAALSHWLIGPYRRAVAFAPKRIGASGGSVTQLALADAVAEAQAILERAVDGASRPGAEGLLELVPRVVDVIPMHDAHGGHGFAPQDVAHAKLASRVLVLLLADYLTRPDAYVRSEAWGCPPRRPSAPMLALG